MRGQDKFLSTKESSPPNSFLFTSFWSESVRYVAFCWACYLRNSCSVTAWVFKLVLYTKAGTRTKCSISKKWLMMGEVVTFKSCHPFSDARTSLLCFQVILHRNNNRTSVWIFVTLCFLTLCSFPSRRFTIHSQRNLMNSTGQDWNDFWVCGKMIGTIGE